MAHKRNPNTGKFVHHFIVDDEIKISKKGEEYRIGRCKVRRCKVVKKWPVDPEVHWNGAWRRTAKEQKKAS